MRPTELHQLISKIRRDMPRAKEVLLLCEEAEGLMLTRAKKSNPLTRAEIQRNYRLRKKGKS